MYKKLIATLQHLHLFP